MRTTHVAHAGDARSLALADASVHLVVTSPPYPMIAMWDALFAAADPRVPELLATDPAAAFEAEHAVLDAAWAQCVRVLVPGGFLCVNVGDATRTLREGFRLWSNHARVIRACEALGLTTLPDILWRKPTNAPNRFMGSGMLPAGAYVTYEHEYVLVFRKGAARGFSTPAEKARRRASAVFWEERNVWFSDLWSGLAGVEQALPRDGAATADPARTRSAAFPLELPWRLVHMYSLYGDVVLDPFAGTGTTALAAACAGRSSVSVENDPALAATIPARVLRAPAQRRAAARLAAHARFVAERDRAGRPSAHRNAGLGVPVTTGQEVALELREAVEAEVRGDTAEVRYASLPGPSAPDGAG